MSLIIPANTLASGGYEVANSLRFNDGSSDYLNRTLGSDGNRQKWTWSGWVKRGTFVASQMIFGCKSGDISASLNFRDDQLRFFDYDDGAFGSQLKTNRLFRDVSAWYHIVVAYDTTQGTAANRIKFYVNGVQETSFATSTYPSEDFNGYINESDYTHYVGSEDGSENFFDGYIAEVCFINDQQLDPTSFGEFDEDSGIFKPIDVSGLTFGTNGFYQEYKQSGTGTNSSGMGADTSGNDNHFAVNNLTAIDQATDTPTNNFCTLNPLAKYSNAPTLSEGNMQAVAGGNDWYHTRGSMGFSKGKWYFEVLFTGGTATNYYTGVTDETCTMNDTDAHAQTGTSIFYNGGGGEMRVDGTTTTNDYGDFNASSDILGVACNFDDGQITIYKNNSAIVTNYSLSTTKNLLFPMGVMYGASNVIKFNFGGCSAFTVSSAAADADGYGAFEYAPPSGYFALCTKNLAEYG